MGRKPNPIILQFFERGPRLADNSNRYPHRCKACGESFPKGRAESLMTHISKKCPAISEADRINACLSLNGLSHHIAAAAAASAGGGTGVRGAGRMAHQAHRLVGDGSHHGRGNGQAMNHGHGHGHGQHMLPTLGMSAAAAASSPSSTVDAAAIQRDWTALETLAEVSRQIDLSEKHDDRTPGSSGSSGGPGGGEGAAKNEGGNGGGSNMNASGTTTSGGLIAVAPSAFETLEHLGQDVSSLFKTEQNGTAGEREAKRRKYAVSEAESHADARFGLYADDPDAITIEQLKRLEAANLSMAAAAAAQLNPSLLDPQLRSEEAMGPNATRLQQQTTTPSEGDLVTAAVTEAMATTTAATVAAMTAAMTATAGGGATAGPSGEENTGVETAVMTDEPMTTVPMTAVGLLPTVDAATASSQPWGEITYLAENILPVFPSSEMSASPGDPSRISFHLNNPNEARPRQARARFNTTRRKEVQEVRRIGACIRCRILRKTCSKGSPCDQCRKVLSPRVWRSGCVRTKFTEQLDIFCAGVQVVLAQHRANQLRDTVSVVSRGLLIEATHFPENPAVAVTLEVLQSSGLLDTGAAAAAAAATAAAAAAAATTATAATAATAAAAAAAAVAAAVERAGSSSSSSEGGMVEVAMKVEGSSNNDTGTTATPGDSSATGEENNNNNSGSNSTAATATVAAPLHLWKDGEIVMVDTGRDDVPLKMEYYMRNVLPEFIRREPSLFVRTLLETSMALAQETNSVLLRKAIELWGLVEILDRERQWQIRVKPAAEGGVGVGVEAPRQIKAETDQETYTTLCLQLTAGAERKAAAISHSLLTTMQRLLQDSKTKIDYSMYFTTLILLSCVEKSTWGFKAWDQESLRATWPLERTPQDFAQQGYVIADLLRMLLGIRRALPRTSCRAEDGMLVTDDEDPLMRNFFDTIKLNYNDVATKQDHPIFSPTDSRSFELLFCSALLLPVRE